MRVPLLHVSERAGYSGLSVAAIGIAAFPAPRGAPVSATPARGAGEPDDAYYCFNFGVNTYIKFSLKYTYILNFSVSGKPGTSFGHGTTTVP